MINPSHAHDLSEAAKKSEWLRKHESMNIGIEIIDGLI